MDLVLNLTFERSLDRKSILVTDLTGSGATGYGGSNPPIADFTNFNIVATPTDPVTLLPTGASVTIPAFPALPSAASGTFTITSLLLLGIADTVIVDGVYKFVISADYVGEVEGTATGTFYAIFYEIVECCIEDMMVDAIGCGCDMDSPRMRNLIKAGVWLWPFRPTPVNGVNGLSPLARLEQWTKAASTLLDLQRICTTQNCKGCGGC